MIYYKVLLCEKDSLRGGNYRGVDREEPFPFEGISKRGLDLWYMYCGYLETTVTGITDQMSVEQLQEMVCLFSREGKTFEVVRFSCDREEICNGNYYGIDVISFGAYSELGGKLPNGEDTWISAGFNQYLNEFGLFSNESEAEKYIEEYGRIRQMSMTENEDVFIVYVEGLGDYQGN